MVKARRSLLASAARTAAINSAKQTDVIASMARVYLSVTAASGTGGLTVFFRGYDLISGNAAKLNGGGTAVTAIGTYVYELSSSAGTAAGDVKETVARPVPVNWDVRVEHADASSYTYSVSCEVIEG